MPFGYLEKQIFYEESQKRQLPIASILQWRQIQFSKPQCYIIIE